MKINNIKKYIKEFADKHNIISALLILLAMIILYFLLNPNKFTNRKSTLQTDTISFNVSKTEIDSDKLMDAIIQTESERINNLSINDYIKHIQVSFNNYTNGIDTGIEDFAKKKQEIGGLSCGLDNFDKIFFRSEFSIIKTEENIAGGLVSYLVFSNNPDIVFWVWVYPYADDELVLRGFCEYDNSEKKSFDTKNINFNDVVKDIDNDKYFWQTIHWKGKVRFWGESTGSFYILDEEHTEENLTSYDWFWAMPQGDPGPSYNFKEWIESFSGIDNYSGSNTFLITGRLLDNDCGYYDENHCIPDVNVIKIEEI